MTRHVISERETWITVFGEPVPTIVCLCGSTRFMSAFQEAMLAETVVGRIVLTIGCDIRSDTDLFRRMSPRDRASLKERLDTLHLRKIDLADEVLILNVGGYIGESTAKELEYAIRARKRIRYLEPLKTETGPEAKKRR
jgi:hypothetical protein